MRTSYSITLLIFLVTVALALSGCSGSNTTTATPTPSGGYTVGTPTPGASPTQGANTLSSVGQLFNIGNLHSYTYRMTTVTGGQTTTANFAMAYTDETYNGVAAKHTSMTYDTPAQGSTPAGQMVIDIYTSKADDHTLGGHMKMVTNGQTVFEMDIPADQASSYTKNDVVASGESNGSTTLTSQGTDVVVVNGKTYTCTKYTYTTEGATYTVWYTPQAPMPVKSTWTDNQGNTYTIELLSWS